MVNIKTIVKDSGCYNSMYIRFTPFTVYIYIQKKSKINNTFILHKYKYFQIHEFIKLGKIISFFLNRQPIIPHIFVNNAII